jgi:TRAP-type C4-dicarboxylate transport system permease small subunit
VLDTLDRVEATIAGWSRNVAVVGVLALLVISAVTLADVLLRWIANAPIRGLNDVLMITAPVVIAACFPLVIARRENIVIRMLGQAISPRTSLWLDAFGSLALLGFVTLVGWQLVVYTVELGRANRTTWQLLIPVAPFWTIATSLVLLCIPAQAAALASDVARAISGTPRPPHGGTEHVL